VLTAITPPALAQVITLTTDKPTYAVGDDIIISGTATPNAAIAIQITNPKGTIILLTTLKADAEGAFERSIKLPPGSSIGEYTVTASQGGATETTTFTIYSAGPRLTVTITPQKAAYTTELITIEVRSNEQLQALPTVTVTQAGAAEKPLSMVAISSTTWSASYAIERGYDGAAIINVEGVNLAGDVGKTIKAFTVDTTPPTLSITVPEAIYEPRATVSGTVDDQTVSFIELTVDTQAPTRLTVIDHAWSTEVSIPTLGPHSFRAEAVDLAGNTGFAVTTTNYLLVAGSVNVVIDLTEGAPGTTIPIWVYTTYEGRPVAVNNISGRVIQPDGTEKDLTFTAVRVGLSKASYTIPAVGAYAVTVDVSWRGIAGTALKPFQGLAFDVARFGEMRSDLSTISTVALVAAGLSLTAAVAAIAAVVQLTRKLVLK